MTIIWHEYFLAFVLRWTQWCICDATFNNISVIWWWSVLLVEETGGPRESHWLVASHWKLYHIMLYRVHLAMIGVRTQTFSITNVINNNTPTRTCDVCTKRRFIRCVLYPVLRVFVHCLFMIVSSVYSKVYL
jgi:hypothetical protein